MDKNTENMLAGKPYRPGTPELNKFSHLAHRLCRDYNLTTDEDTVERGVIIDRLFPQHADGIYLQGPVHIDYGRFTKDIPDNSLVLGVPGKVIRPITEKDRLGNFPY